MSSSVHFVLVCGAWHITESWDPVRKLLSNAGYDSTAVSLASVGVSQGNCEMPEDAAKIRSATQEVIDRGEDAIVVLHSYAGQPGSEAMQGLEKTERQKKGLQGGVVRMVIISGYVVPEGFQDAQREKPAPPFDWMKWHPEV